MIIRTHTRIRIMAAAIPRTNRTGITDTGTNTVEAGFRRAAHDLQTGLPECHAILRTVPKCDRHTVLDQGISGVSPRFASKRRTWRLSQRVRANRGDSIDAPGSKLCKLNQA